MRIPLKEKRVRFWAAAGFWFAASILFSGQTAVGDFLPVASGESDVLKVKVFRLIMDPATNQPVVILTDPLEKRGLLIWIDNFTANAIHSEMQGISHRRPLTHDLLVNIIQSVHLNIKQVVITHMEEGIYHAMILMEKGGSMIKIDARPSDSIVLALKYKAPIFVFERLFREASVPIKDEKEVEENYGLSYQDLTSSLAEAFSFHSTHGVLISAVRAQSQAEKDGIERGDIIVEIEGQAITDGRAMSKAFTKDKSPVQAKVFRNARFITIIMHLHMKD
jgi:bifunctional DNase/RNase